MNEEQARPAGRAPREPADGHVGDSEQKRVRLLVDASNDAFIETDSNEVVLEWNRAAESLFGWPREDIVGRDLQSTVFAPDALADLREVVAELAGDRRQSPPHRRLEVEAVRRDGTPLTVRLTLWTVRLGGEVRLNVFAHDLGERMRFQEELRRLAIAATTDQGTGLKNRRGFFALAEHEISVAQRLGQMLTLIFIDLDRLKDINDSLGHLEGDHAIADAAAILKSTFRESDLVARLGGDEFCVLALGSERSLSQTIGRLEGAVEAHNSSAGRPFKLSLSYGVAFYDPADRSTTLDDLISKADASMYQRKLKRNRPA